MAKQIGLNECLFLGHRGELDLLDTDELLVVILGNEQVGQVGNGFNGRNVSSGQTLLAIIDHARLELAQLASDLVCRQIDGGVHVRTMLGNANHRATGANGDLDDGGVGI